MFQIHRDQEDWVYKIVLDGYENAKDILKLFKRGTYQRKKIKDMLGYMKCCKKESILWKSTFVWNKFRRQYLPEDQYSNEFTDLFTLHRDDYYEYSEKDIMYDDVDYVETIELHQGYAEESKESLEAYCNEVKRLLPKSSCCYNALCKMLDEVIDTYNYRFIGSGIFIDINKDPKNPVYVEIEYTIS